MILDGEHTGSPLVALEDKPRAALTLDVDTVACSVKAGNDEDAAVLRPRKRARQGSVDAPAANADAIEDAIEDAIMSEGLSSESLSAEALFYSPSEQEEVRSQEPGAGVWGTDSEREDRISEDLKRLQDEITESPTNQQAADGAALDPAGLVASPVSAADEPIGCC